MTISNISVPGGTICVEAAGEGPLVVCSPAMGDSRDAFAPFSRRLVEAGFRVASADLRGHGDSSTGFGSYGDEPPPQPQSPLEKSPRKSLGSSFSGLFCAARRTQSRSSLYASPSPARGDPQFGAFTRADFGRASATRLRPGPLASLRSSNGKAIGPPFRKPHARTIPSPPRGSTA